jgi:hypothetical protein
MRLMLPSTFATVRQQTSSLVRHAGGILLYASTQMDARKEVSTRAALVRYSRDGDSAEVIDAWDDLRYFGEGRYLAPRTLFPAEMLFDLSPGATYAAGDGMQYCVTIKPAAPGAPGNGRVLQICREWERPLLGAGIRDPDFSVLPDPVEHQRIHRRQQLPERMPSYDELRFDLNGRLWVRTVGPDMAEIHPVLLSWFPERGPSTRSWDVFAPAGELLATVILPSTFRPMVITADRAFGYLKLESGEIAIGVAGLPPF